MTCTAFLESTPAFRKWCAIATISAALERSVWINTGQPLFPNLYVWLVGPAAVGKTRPINFAKDIANLAGLFTSGDKQTAQGMVDVMHENCLRTYDWPNNEKEQWYSMFVAVPELSTYIEAWNPTTSAVLTALYDCGGYREAKRGENHRLDLDKTHVAMLAGTTPTSLLQAVPDQMWGQGLMSRVILIHSLRKDIKPILNVSASPDTSTLVHDLKLIRQGPLGQIEAMQDFKDLFHEWRENGMQPKPTQPRLRDYCARRDTHLLKLAMVICVDRDDPPFLTADHYYTAIEWLHEAERDMAGPFMDGSATADSRSMDDIVDFFKGKGEQSEQTIRREIRKKFSPTLVNYVFESLKTEGRIKRAENPKFWIFLKD